MNAKVIRMKAQFVSTPDMAATSKSTDLALSEIAKRPAPEKYYQD